MTDTPTWITEAEIVSLISLPEAVDALERVLALEADGKASNMPKGHLMVGANNAMHALGASVSGDGLCGFKTWVNISGKSSTVLVLFSLEDGSLQAIMEATALGQMRTAAMTGVGTRRMAPAGADEMALIGGGKQALPQIAACAAVRPLKRVRVFSRNEERREAFAATVRAEFDFEVIASPTLEDAVAGMPIVTLITNSTTPFLTAGMLARGAHVNAMGAIVPARTEFTGDVFDRCGLIAVDNVQNIRNLSAEFKSRFGDDDKAWGAVTPMSRIIADGVSRPDNCDLTLFKAMGMGVSDLALGIEILKRARAANKGHALPERIKTPPRLKG